jgi:hypothetical protein
MNAYFEVLVGFEDGLGIVDMGASVEDGQGALAEQGIETAGTDFAQLLDFTLRQRLQAAFGADGGVDDIALGHLSLSCAGKTSFFDNTIQANRRCNEGGFEKACTVSGVSISLRVPVAMNVPGTAGADARGRGLEKPQTGAFGDGANREGGIA